MEHGTSESRFLIELDGISAVRASDVSGMDQKHTPFKLWESNRTTPNIGRANFEVGEISIKHAHALNQTGEEFFEWFQGWKDGSGIERRDLRVIVMDEDGQSPVATYEFHRCLPSGFGPDTHKGGGSDASYFNCKIEAEDMFLV